MDPTLYILELGIKKAIKKRNRDRVEIIDLTRGILGISYLGNLVTEYVFGRHKIVPAAIVDSLMKLKEFQCAAPNGSDLKIWFIFEEYGNVSINICGSSIPHGGISWGDILDILMCGYSPGLVREIGRCYDEHEVADFMNKYYDFLMRGVK